MSFGKVKKRFSNENTRIFNDICMETSLFRFILLLDSKLIGF